MSDFLCDCGHAKTQHAERGCTAPVGDEICVCPEFLSRNIIQITQEQREFLELMEMSPRGYRTRTQQGSDDMQTLGLLGMACNIYELGDGRFTGCITQAGREVLNRFKLPASTATPN